MVCLIWGGGAGGAGGGCVWAFAKANVRRSGARSFMLMLRAARGRPSSCKTMFGPDGYGILQNQPLR